MARVLFEPHRADEDGGAGRGAAQYRLRQSHGQRAAVVRWRLPVPRRRPRPDHRQRRVRLDAGDHRVQVGRQSGGGVRRRQDAWGCRCVLALEEASAAGRCRRHDRAGYEVEWRAQGQQHHRPGWPQSEAGLSQEGLHRRSRRAGCAVCWHIGFRRRTAWCRSGSGRRAGSRWGSRGQPAGRGGRWTQRRRGRARRKGRPGIVFGAAPSQGPELFPRPARWKVGQRLRWCRVRLHQRSRAEDSAANFNGGISEYPKLPESRHGRGRSWSWRRRQSMEAPGHGCARQRGCKDCRGYRAGSRPGEA